jgi:hypothetical protein
MPFPHPLHPHSQKKSSFRVTDKIAQKNLQDSLVILCFLLNKNSQVLCKLTSISTNCVLFLAGKYSNTLWATTGIMHLFLCINASINFLVYLTMSSKFKATLWHMCGRSRPEGADELSGKSVSEAGTVAAASISTMSDKL